MIKIISYHIVLEKHHNQAVQQQRTLIAIVACNALFEFLFLSFKTK